MTPKQSHPADEAVIDRARGAVVREGAQRTPRQRLMGSTAQPRGPPAEAASLEATSKLVASVTVEPDAFSIYEFCARHRISPQLFYKFKDQMPATFRIGARVLISKEAAARWRAEREAASAAEAAATTT